MAVCRALAFRAFTGVGETCGAFEMSWEEGPDWVTARVIRECSRPPEVTWQGTGLCRPCHDQLQAGVDRRLPIPRPGGE